MNKVIQNKDGVIVALVDGVEYPFFNKKEKQKVIGVLLLNDAGKLKEGIETDSIEILKIPKTVKARDGLSFRQDKYFAFYSDSDDRENQSINSVNADKAAKWDELNQKVADYYDITAFPDLADIGKMTIKALEYPKF